MRKVEQSVIKFFLLIILTCLTGTQFIEYFESKKRSELAQAILYLIALISMFILSLI